MGTLITDSKRGVQCDVLRPDDCDPAFRSDPSADVEKGFEFAR
jgi:hypothetical protein